MLEEVSRVKDLIDFLRDEPKDHKVVFIDFHIYVIPSKPGHFPESETGHEPVMVTEVGKLRDWLGKLYDNFPSPNKNLDISFRTEGLYVHDMNQPPSKGWYAHYWKDEQKIKEGWSDGI